MENQGTRYFPSRHGNNTYSNNQIDGTRNNGGGSDLIIFSIFHWGLFLVSSYSSLLAIRFNLAAMQDDDNMAYRVLAFISQAAKDCVTKAKTIMAAVTEVDQPPRPKLRINGSIIVMGMGYYRRVRCPCSRFHIE